MPLLSPPTFTAKASLAYLTIGAILDVWSSVWYFTTSSPLEPSTRFWIIGFFLTGAALILIGLLMGPLGRFARNAELPPKEVIDAETLIQKKAAGTPDVINPVAVAPEPPQELNTVSTLQRVP